MLLCTLRQIQLIFLISLGCNTLLGTIFERTLDLFSIYLKESTLDTTLPVASILRMENGICTMMKLFPDTILQRRILLRSISCSTRRKIPCKLNSLKEFFFRKFFFVLGIFSLLFCCCCNLVICFTYFVAFASCSRIHWAGFFDAFFLILKHNL